MPTRYLKPGVRDSGHLEFLAHSPDAEILYYRLLVTVDDFGRFDGRGDMVKANCFPIRKRATADKCIQWLTELRDADLLILYAVDGKEYLQIRRWDNKPRAERSKYPDPPTDVYNCPQMLPVTVTVTETVTKTETETTTAPTPTASTPKHNGKIAFNFEKGCFAGISEEQELRWQDAYPAVPIPPAIEQAAAWARANPANRKSNWERFLVNWFKREQDKAARVR